MRKLDEKVDSFKFQHKIGDPKSERKLAQLRKQVSDHNASNPEQKQRVALQGRLGKNNPNAKKYPRVWGLGTRIKKADAGHFDVYVHNRYEETTMAGKEVKEGTEMEEKSIVEMVLEEDTTTLAEVLDARIRSYIDTALFGAPEMVAEEETEETDSEE